MNEKALQTRARICQAAAEILGEAGPAAFTTDRVAARADCAKGLVHYHFRSKVELLAEVVRWTGEERVRRFRASLRTPDAIGESWAVILEERTTGILAVTGALAAVAPEIAQAIRDSDQALADVLARGASRLLARDRQTLRVPHEHVGHLLVALVHGAVTQLAAGGDAVTLEDAYATGWLGILSLGAHR